jgi:cytochrome P450
VWKTRVEAEIRSLLSNHGTNIGSEFSQLSQLSLATWEQETPILDSCIRETMRLVLNNVAMREIVSEYMEIEGVKFKRGDCVLYPFSDAHMNKEIWENPSLFNPARFGKGEEGNGKKYPFLGWGAGNYISY